MLTETIAPPYSVDAVGSMDDVMEQIQGQIRRLAWSVEQVQQFIAAKFDGKRRSQLTDDELILLLYYFQSYGAQAAPS